jgi:CHAT domain-containing protein
LHLNEIARARWHASLVVLSACKTLEGPLYSGEEMVGLARAFLAGGAGTVVATQWPVGVPSADLIGAFYRQLVAGDTPAAALHRAQLVPRRAPVTSHPFYWAGYVTVEGR